MDGQPTLIWVSPSGHRYSTEPDTRMNGGTNDNHPTTHDADNPWKNTHVA